MWGGLSLASLGEQVFAVVLSWSGAALLGTDAGYLAATQALGMLMVAVLSGGWAERVEHRRIMVVADMVRGGALAVTAAVWLVAGGPLAWTLFPVAFLVMGGIALYRPAMQTVLPGIVPDDAALPATNALIDTSERIARFAGPLLAGAAAALPLGGVTATAALGYGASALCGMAMIRLGPERLAAARIGGWLAALREGFRAVRPHPLLWFMLWVNMVINGAWFGAFFVGLPLIVERGGGGLAMYGQVMAAYGGSNLLATLLMGSAGMRAMAARTVFIGNGLLGLGIVGMGVAGLWLGGWALFVALLAGAFVSAAGGPMQDITIATMRQVAIPRAALGGAVRAYMLVNQVGSLIAMLAAPTAFALIGIAPSVIASGLAIVVVGLVGLARFGDVRS